MSLKAVYLLTNDGFVPLPWFCHTSLDTEVDNSVFLDNHGIVNVLFPSKMAGG